MTTVDYIAIGLALAFYPLRRVWVGPLSRIARVPLAEVGVPLADAESIARLALAGLSQLVLFFLLRHLTGVGVPVAADLPSFVFGICLGVAQFGAGSQVAAFFYSFAPESRIAYGVVDRRPTQLARGGWMRHYRAAMRTSTVALGLPLTVLYVTGEELIFRFILLNTFGALGHVFAVFLATACFMAVQVLAMPTWTSALFPVAGALVVGLSNGALVVGGTGLLPLVVAHSTFFLFPFVFDRADPDSRSPLAY